jgi:hypothetical protein
VNNLPPVGNFDEIRLSDGVIRGWSYDPNNSSVSNQVHIYFDGPAGASTQVFGVATNIFRNDVNSTFGITGSHGFEFVIPSQYRNGISHTVHVYGIDLAGGNNPLLPGSPKSFVMSITTPPPPTSACTTPDPFISLGGGTCVNSGWLPPGHPDIPKTQPPPPLPPPPAPQPPPPPPSSTINISTCRSITASGNYRLTSDLTVGSSTCVDVHDTSNVNIDCNNFKFNKNINSSEIGIRFTNVNGFQLLIAISIVVAI